MFVKKNHKKNLLIQFRKQEKFWGFKKCIYRIHEYHTNHIVLLFILGTYSKYTYYILINYNNIYIVQQCVYVSVL